MRLHRWEYDFTMRHYFCADPPVGAVDSGQWCFPGCGVIVTDLELRNSKLPVDNTMFLHVSLDNLANLILERGR